MVDVTNDFKLLSDQSGRYVYCKIIAGNTTFFDDKILEFDFEDICHPEWFTIGTACPNKFTFSVLYNGELMVGDTVKPYISFDNSEWCPLGVFYVARRYVRGKNASITCYDKMYYLDDEYIPTIQAPTTTDAVLRDVCSAAGLECDDYGNDYDIKEIPRGHTLRDMIGYIAALNFRSAKLGRDEKLLLKNHTDYINYAIRSRNCTDYSRNLDYSTITCLSCDTGNDILVAGDGALTSTIELYNPLMTQEILNILRLKFNSYRFYGGEFTIQGMPFFESGDGIYFMEDKITLYPIVLSEIDYHYDGALTAKVYSRNRSYTDAAVHKEDLDAALDEIRAQLGNICIKQTNENALSLGSSPVTAASFEFLAKARNTFAQIDLNFTAGSASGKTFNIDLYVNGEKISRTALHIAAQQNEMLHYYYLADNLPKGANKIEVQISMSQGTANIPKNQLIATLVGKGMGGGNSGNTNDRLTIYEDFLKFDYSHADIGIAGFSAFPECDSAQETE